jgi:hypothetical protein
MESVRGACLTTMTTQISINVNKVAITVYRDLCVSVSTPERRCAGTAHAGTQIPVNCDRFEKELFLYDQVTGIS